MANSEQAYSQTETVDQLIIQKPRVVSDEETYLNEMVWISVPDLISDAKSDLDRALKQNEHWMLPGTGFSIPSQMQRLYDSLQSPVSSVEEFNERVDRWIHDAEVDIISFNLEYLSDRCVYPIQLAKTANGEIICPQYGNVGYEDIVLDTERNGSVKRSAHEISQFLRVASPGSLAFFTSPPGWSGLFTDQGKPIVFPDTQTYLFRVTDMGTIEAATVQTTMTMEQNKKFLESAGETFPEDFDRKTEPDKITDIVSRVVIGDTNGRFAEIPFEEIVKKIQSITGSREASKGVSFSSIYHDLNRIDDLMRVDQERQQVIDNLKRRLKQISISVLSGKALLSDFAPEIGSAVLSLAAYAQREPQTPVWEDSSIHQNNSPRLHPLPVTSDINSTLSYLQSRPGCNGGGSVDFGGKGMTSILSAGGLRLGKIENKQDSSPTEWEWKKGNCRPSPEGCGRKDVLVGPCDICRNCQAAYDAGRKK